MNLVSVRLERFYLVQFTKEEVELMTACSQRHYDWTGRKLSERNGSIYGMKMRMELFEKNITEWELSFYDIDLLMKVLEADRDPLSLSLYVKLKWLILPNPELELNEPGLVVH